MKNFDAIAAITYLKNSLNHQYHFRQWTKNNNVWTNEYFNHTRIICTKMSVDFVFSKDNVVSVLDSSLFDTLEAIKNNLQDVARNNFMEQLEFLYKNGWK